MGKIGCALLLLVAGLFGFEIWIYLLVSRHIGDYLVPLVVIGVLSAVGVTLIRRTIPQIPLALFSGGGGRLMVRIIAGGLLVFPGLATDALGLLLLLPGFTRLFSTIGEKLLAVVIKRSMSAMMQGGQGGAGGFAAFAQFGKPGGAGLGGFPGFPGFPAPGGSGPTLSPDQRATFRGGTVTGPGAKKPKTYDTTAEKE